MEEFYIDGIPGVVSQNPVPSYNAHGSVTIFLPAATDLSSLIAELKVSPGAKASVGGLDQTHGVTDNNFTNPLLYTITAQDGVTKRTYIVNLLSSYSITGNTVTGTVGTLLGTGQIASLTVEGDTVAANLSDVVVSSWFTNLPAGMTVTANATAPFNRINFTFVGTPTQASSQPYEITIPAGVFTRGIATPPLGSSNTKFAIAAIATIEDTTVTGTVSIPLGGVQTATLTIVGDTVVGALSDVDASSWFANLPTNMTVTASAPANSKTITLTFGGTPTAVSSQPLDITIPAWVVTSGIDASLSENLNARFAIAALASIADTTVNGTVGTPLSAGQTAKITLLSGDTVAGALLDVDVSSWFANLPTNMTVTAYATANSNIITLTFGGTPAAASNQPFQITIPAGVVASGIATQPVNQNAKFAIAAIASIADTTVTGTVNTPLGGVQTATLTLTGDTVVASGLNNVNASSWFANLPTGMTVTAYATASSTIITLTFGGTPAAASNQPFQIIVPASVTTSGSSVSLPENLNARFAIAAIASIADTTVTGTLNTPLGSGQTATLTLTGDTVAASGLNNVDASSWFANLPTNMTVTANAPAGSSYITLTFGGTPAQLSNQSFQIALPAGLVASGIDVSLPGNPNARFAIAALANIADTTVTGTAGTPLSGGQTATLTLTGDTVAAGGLNNVNASSWFTNLPTGMTVTAYATASSNIITLTFGGTPAAASSQPFNITIPAGALTSGIATPLPVNPNARFAIAATPRPPSPLPKTGDGFPLYALALLLGAGLTAAAYAGWRLRKRHGRS